MIVRSLIKPKDPFYVFCRVHLTEMIKIKFCLQNNDIFICMCVCVGGGGGGGGGL